MAATKKSRKETKDEWDGAMSSFFACRPAAPSTFVSVPQCLRERVREVCSCIRLKCAGLLYLVLGLHVIILGGKRHASLLPPRVLHGFVHQGNFLHT